MKLTKKILSLVLAAALLLGTVAIAAQAEGLTAQAGSVLTYKIVADKTDVKIGETVTLSVYMTTNYYTGSMGGEYFLWTNGIFEDFDNTTVGNIITAKNYASRFTNTITKAATGSYPSTHTTKDENGNFVYVGIQSTRVYNPAGATPTTIEILDNELVYEVKLTVKNDESLIGKTATFELPAGSLRTPTQQGRKCLIYQTINANPTGGAWSEAANCAETTNLNEAKVTLNIVAAATKGEITGVSPSSTYVGDTAVISINVTDSPESLRIVAPDKEYTFARADANIETTEAGETWIVELPINAEGDNACTVYADYGEAGETDGTAFTVEGIVKKEYCDYAVLEAAVAKAPEKAKEYYDATEYAAWERAVVAGNELLAAEKLEKSDENQKTINDAAALVEDTLAALDARYLSLAKLNAAVAAYAAIDPADKDYYVSSDYEAWEIALAEAKAAQTDYNETMPATKQAEVDAYADALEAAWKKLAADYVDLAKLNKAVADYAAPTYAAEYYDATAWSNWEAALAEAKTAQTTYATAPVTAQATVDGIADALEAAFEALVPAFVDLTELEKACYDCHNPMFEPEWFDADEYAAWEAAYAAAEKGVEDYTDKADTEENRAAVAKLAKDLVDAYNELDARSVDVSDLEKAIAESVPAYAAEYYDAAAYKAFEDAVAAGTAIVNEMGGGAAPDTAENRATVADAAEAIRNAYAKLVPAFLDTSSITETIAESVPAYAEEYYDATAWSEFQDTVAQAAKAAEDMKTLADTEENREMVYNWTNAVLDVYAALVPSFVSYEKVEKALADYSTAPNPEIYYTPDSWEAYEAALAAANDANENRPQPLPAATEANQAAVDKFATDLEAAYKGLTPAGGCSIISVTALQADYVMGDVVNFEFLCEGSGYSKIQVITESGATSTFHRTHSSVKDIYVKEDGNEVWVIAQKITSNVDITRYAKAKVGKVWDSGLTAFQFVPTKEDASVKSVEILLGDEAVTEFLNTDTVTIKIVTGPAARRIRLVNPVTGSTSTFSTPAAVNADGTKVWTITRKYATVKDYAFDIYTANSTNVLADSGADLTFTVNKYVAPQLPSTGNVDDAVIAASVAKARILKDSTQTFTITTDKAAKQVRLVNTYGNVVYKATECVSEDGATKTWVITTGAYNTLGTYNYTVEALYEETWLADADGALTFKVLY
ncbi:MAG: hypothetical protein IKK85_01020 [Clostridia bacterium]|nr:hypothetical protein [Clostridia bacterium]